MFSAFRYLSSQEPALQLQKTVDWDALLTTTALLFRHDGSNVKDVVNIDKQPLQFKFVFVTYHQGILPLRLNPPRSIIQGPWRAVSLFF